MAGSFTAPSASSKMKLGKANRPKSTTEIPTGLSAQPRTYQITDSFAARTIPSQAARKASSHTKSSFNSVPARHSGKGF